MNELVWDASALLLLINQEAGWSELVELLPTGAISSVNLSEVAAKLVERGGSIDQLRPFFGRLSFVVHPFTAEQAYLAGALRLPTRAHGLSFGDRACLALGIERKVPVLTADRAWVGIEVGVEIRLLR